MIVRLWIVLLAAVLVSGCSGVEKKRQGYLQSQSIAPLKVPPPMVAPAGNEQLPVPKPKPMPGVTAETPFNTSPPVNLPQEEPRIETDTSEEKG